MRAQVVIGAGFGDEGKGLVTSHLAAQAGPDALVVRFNGGAQAGHTVVASDGRRHVFSHVASGSFTGARTYLSRHFVANPLLYLKERAVLSTLGLHPRVLIDAAAPVTTPFDMLINQMAEQARGAGRHGSCGVGFGETVERSLRPQFRLTVADLRRPDLTARLAAIRDAWVPARLAALGIAAAASPLAPVLDDPALIPRWMEDATTFIAEVEIAGPAILAEAARRDALVFEGAQGLLLDQDRGWFPYVTRSHTGIRNVLDLAEEAGIDRLETVYATRAYVTRHGSGPLPGELAEPPYAGIRDETNIENPFQGRLRFAHLDLDRLAGAIEVDLGDARGRQVTVAPRLAVTCLDQLQGPATYIEAGRICRAGEGAFLDAILRRTGLSEALAAHGPDRGSIEIGRPARIRAASRG